MTINLGTQFEQDLITLAGWLTTAIDGGSTIVDLVNATGGKTTVRATIVATVPTTAIQGLIAKYTGGTTTTSTGTTSTGTGTTTTGTNVGIKLTT